VANQVCDDGVWTFDFVIISIDLDVRESYGIGIRWGVSFILVVQLSSLLNYLLHLNEGASVRSPNAVFHVHVYQIVSDFHLRLLGAAKMVYTLWWIADLEALNI
jgi:hypothetical protein